MLEDPRIDARVLAAALATGYGLEASSFDFMPSHDPASASYAVTTDDGRRFAKVRIGAFDETPLLLPRRLLEAGIPQVIAPIVTASGTLWHPIAAGMALVLAPFVGGRSAMTAGMGPDAWRTFGSALRAVHDVDLELDLPNERFALPSAALVREMLAPSHARIRSPAADRLAGVLERMGDRIGELMERAESLADRLRPRLTERVVCHADIHAANLLVADDGRIFLVDWDGPMRAPRERDLLFVIGSRIARKVEPHEEGWFFEGYGEVTVDPEAIVYFRHERVLEDIGVSARSVLHDPSVPEASRAEEADLLESFFAPGGIVETIEVVRGATPT